MLFAEADDQLQFVRDNLARHKQCVIATVSPNGSPWAVCVNMTFDDDLNIIWQSRSDTQHSQYINANSNMSICVYSESPEDGDFGFYATATTHQVTDIEELQVYLKLRYTDKGLPAPDPASMLGDSPLRLYKAVPSAVWINDASRKKQAVDLRRST